MHRLGLDPSAIDLIFLSHFHGDHVLGLPTYVLHRAFVSETPLTVVGPAGVEARMEELFRISWGDEWDEIKSRLQLSYREAERQGEVAGITYETVLLDHGASGCNGYRLRIGGRRLAYSGDTVASPPLEELLKGSDVAIVEATAPGEPYSHLSWAQAAEMRGRHPGTKFVFNHIFEGDLDGAAEDLTVIDV